MISRLWGLQAGFDYLENLIRDNRGGERTGFRREVVDEIVFLRTIIAARLKAEPPEKAPFYQRRATIT